MSSEPNINQKAGQSAGGSEHPSSLEEVTQQYWSLSSAFRGKLSSGEQTSVGEAIEKLRDCPHSLQETRAGLARKKLLDDVVEGNV